MRIQRKNFLIGLAVIGLMFSGCSTKDTTPPSENTIPDSQREVSKAQPMDINELPLKDNKTLYANQDPTSLIYFYITITGGNAADQTNHTFEEVNSYDLINSMTDTQRIKTEIIFQVGDQYGPLPGEVGYGAMASNATICVRGHTSTYSPQKSYRIDLFDNAGLWRGQRAIAINKHPADPTRLRNMLYFSLLQDVPDTTSLRTQFVNVFIKDQMSGEKDFTDFGLFTQVELPNGRYLRNHGLSRDGNLYKAIFNEFYRYEDTIRLATDPLYNRSEFDDFLEPKTGENHKKLIEMLDAVNDYSIPIEDIISKYFNIDNLTSYLAYNILMNNSDSSSQNNLLYSPVNSSIWFFLFWDGDGCLSNYENKLLKNTWVDADWQFGVSNYWGVVLFNRMLRVKAYRDALKEKVELLRGIITPERITAEIEKYRTVVDQFTARMPDKINLHATLEDLDLIYENLPKEPEIAYQRFLSSLEKPMPFFLGSVESDGKEILLSWAESYDFDAEFIYYNVQIAKDWSFAPNTIVYESLDQLPSNTIVPMLPPGNYYWRIIARNESGKTQIPFDQVATDSGLHQGMRRFIVLENGKVENPL
jgi:spore coat protein H